MAPCSTVVSQRTLFTTRVVYKFTFVWYSLKQSTKHRPTSHLAHLYTVRFIWLRGKQTAAELVWWFCWPVLVVATLESKHFLQPHLFFQPMWGVGRSWLFPASSIKFVTRRSLKSLWVYLTPHEITVSNCWVVFDPEIWKIILCSAWSFVDSWNSC